MQARILLVALTLFVLAGCSTNPRTMATTPATRVYHGSASVGDFMTITIDSNAQTIAYNDVSNGDSGTVPYTVNSNGTYTISDPQANLSAAYEVPNYAMVVQAAKTGPASNTPALITAVESGPISMATFEGQSYNYMQFRTAAGGMEVGSVTVNAQGSGSISSFWPYGAYNGGNQGSPFNSGTIDMTQAQLDSSGTFLKVPEPGNSSVFDYVFGTANGIFAVDTANGAILGLKKAASKNFDPSFAGTYSAIYYQKTGASTGQGNIESGLASLGNATLVVTSGAQVTVTDAQGNTMVQAMLTPVADVDYLYDGSSGELQDPCYGVFHFRVNTSSLQQDVFVSFLNRAMLFSSFTANLPFTNNGTYNYFYGVGLK